ncbi:MAG TPA: paraquat-inducible protein A [Burkholderiales bacterium]|nr:paraquat-inducible protein A [Burkholderiales bacterium]
MSAAAERGLFSCGTCGLVSRAPAAPGAACPRCHTRLAFRKPRSIAHCWAYLVAAMALYVPANTLPIMYTSSLFGSSEDTILSGVLYLWDSGSWYLALIVFAASIVVPLAKIIALVALAVSVQFGWSSRRAERARLYRLVESIGRWSMLDIFVVALLVALVQLTALAAVRAGPAAPAFGAVVVLTMAAAQSFDPRLIWDDARR